MERKALRHLLDWKARPGRKPLVLRGARQVGKSYLARLLAERAFDGLVEINLEQEPGLAELFASKDPARILPRLELAKGQAIVPGRTLLFLDEIQAAPQLLATLRYFHEQAPELHVIAAGSLLDFVLADHAFSMPVGRIEYLHLGPMDFEEALLATGQERLVAYLEAFDTSEGIPGPIHEQLLMHLRRYVVSGGMPEVVRTLADTGSHRDAEIVKRSILATFKDDFAKYRGQVDADRVRKVFERLPLLVGQKMKWVNVDREARSRDLSKAYRLLEQARVAYGVHHSSCNAVPLGAEVNDKVFKPLFLDVGLLVSECGLSLMDVEAVPELTLVNEGALAEQLIGQHLLYLREPYEEPRLHYWTREQRGAAAELDYVLSEGPLIYPVEVKAGKTGRLRSLHVFMAEKGRGFGLRFNSEPPSLLEAETCVQGFPAKPYRLLSLPLYLVGQTRRLVRAAARFPSIP
jgi:uncharacterized protein